MRKDTRKKIGLTVFTVAGVLTVASLVYASGGGDMTGEHGTLSPAKLKDLLWRVMNFTALVVILVLALKKPIANGLKGRRQGIQQQFDELEARKSEAEQTYKEYEGRLAKLDGEVKSIIEAAVAQGESEKVRIIEDANRAADDIKRQAENAVQHEIAEAKKNLKDDVAEQAAKMAEELIKKNLNDADQVTLINDYLEKVGGMQ